MNRRSFFALFAATPFVALATAPAAEPESDFHWGGTLWGSDFKARGKTVVEINGVPCREILPLTVEAERALFTSPRFTRR